MYRGGGTAKLVGVIKSELYFNWTFVEDIFRHVHFQGVFLCLIEKAINGAYSTWVPKSVECKLYELNYI